jgi:GDP-L-fucose synthase
MKKVLITGSDGLVGNAIKRESQRYKDKYEFIFSSRKGSPHQPAADLTEETHVKALYNNYKPNYVIHTAAKVGGIGGNMMGHGEYLYKNLLMNAYMIHHAELNNVEKMMSFSSVCVFPDNAEVLREDLMHEGPPFEGNFAYAHAKRMVDIQIQAYKSQYGVKNYCSIIPGNIFGTHDLYNLEHAHVIPALIHKMYLAKKNNEPFKVWGDGKSTREFIFVNDIAGVLCKMLDEEEIPDKLLICGTKQHSISQIVDMLVESADFNGEVIYESDKPNGQRARRSDISLLKSLYPEFESNQTNIKEAIDISYKWFEENYGTKKVRI